MSEISLAKEIDLLAKFSDRRACLSDGERSLIIQLAWADKVAFETIHERTGWSEAEVIRLMRLELRPNSFRLWRQRMRGRATKHRTLRSPAMKYRDQLVG